MSPEESLQTNMIPAVELFGALGKLGWGTTTVTIRVHDSKVVDIVGHNFKNSRFKEGENAKALASLIEEIKAIHDQKKSGTFSFTLTFEKGDIKTVCRQDSLRRSYRWDPTP